MNKEIHQSQRKGYFYIIFILTFNLITYIMIISSNGTVAFTLIGLKDVAPLYTIEVESFFKDQAGG